MVPLALEWKRCADGLEVVDYGLQAEPETTPPGSLPLPLGRDGIWLRYRSARENPVLLETVDFENPIALQYINTRSIDQRVRFHERYGFLSEGIAPPDAQARTETRMHEESHAAFSQALTKAFGKSPSEKSDVLNNLLKSASLTTSVEVGTNGKGRMVFHPKNLLHFMCLEVAMAAMNDITLTSCGSCENVFLTGPLAHRRSDARFCSDKCRVAAMRRRRASAHEA